MRVGTIFLANYAESKGGVLYISGAFPEWWETPALGTLIPISIIIETHLDPGEVGQTFDFEVTLRRPDDTEWPIAQVKARRDPKPTDPDLPDYYNLVSAGVPVDFRQEGLHRFNVRRDGDKLAGVNLFVRLAPPIQPAF